MEKFVDLVNTCFPFRCEVAPRPDVKARIIQPNPNPSSGKLQFIFPPADAPLGDSSAHARIHGGPRIRALPGGTLSTNQLQIQLPNRLYELIEIDGFPDVAVCWRRGRNPGRGGPLHATR